MPATLTTVNSILKEVYEKQITDQLQVETVVMRRIEKTSDGVTANVGGKYVVFPIRVARNAGIGARAEGEQLPTAGNQGYAAAQVGLKYLYGSVQLNGQVIELADKDFQAFASALQMEMDGLKKDLSKDQNRQFWGSTIGTLATITADGANTVTVSNTQYLEVGQIIDVLDNTTLANATPTVKFGGRIITAINTTTGVVTYSGADGTSVATDVVVRSGNGNRELTGFSQIVAASGTLYNINPGTTTQWVSTVDSNAGTPRALSEGLMILQCDRVRQLGSKVSAIFVNLGVRRAYFNLLSQQRRYTNTQEFDGGFSGLAFTTDSGDIPVVVDLDCPTQKMFFLTEDQIKLYRESDWHFMDRDGSSWQRIINFDAYQATMLTYQEIGTHKRNAHALMSDLIEG